MLVDVQGSGSSCRNVRYGEIGVAFGFGAVRGLGRSTLEGPFRNRLSAMALLHVALNTAF